MTDIDKQKLLRIKEILTQISQLNIDDEDYKKQALGFLKELSQYVVAMTPWKIGCVKDTYDSDLWKNLEHLLQMINNPQYTNIVENNLPIILDEIKNLDPFIEYIFENEISLALSPPDDPKKERDARKTLKAVGPRPGFENIRKLMDFFKDGLNLSTSAHYLENITNNDAIMTDNDYAPGLLRTLQILGEVSKQLSTDIKDAGNPVCWEILEKIRDVLAHKTDLGSSACYEKVENFLNGPPGSPEQKLTEQMMIDILRMYNEILHRKNIHDGILQSSNFFVKDEPIYKPIMLNLGDTDASGTPYPAIRIFCDLLANKNLTLTDGPEGIELTAMKVRKGGSDGAAKPSSLASAINISAMILTIIDRLAQFRNHTPTKTNLSMQEAFNQIPLVQYVCEYQYTEIGQLCKKLIQSKGIELISNKELIEEINACDLLRDQLMHHQYEIDDEAIFNSLDQLINMMGPTLKAELITLEIKSLLRTLNQEEGSYALLAQQINSSKGKSPAVAFRLIRMHCDTFLNKCNDPEALKNKEWDKQLIEGHDKAKDFYLEEINKYQHKQRRYLAQLEKLEETLNLITADENNPNNELLQEHICTIKASIEEATTLVNSIFSKIEENINLNIKMIQAGLDTSLEKVETKLTALGKPSAEFTRS